MSQLAYPLFVVVALKLLFRLRALYFAEHVIFALHILACVFLSFVVLWPVYFLFARWARARSLSTAAYFAIAAASMLAYLVVAERRAYSEPWLAASAKSVVIFLVYFVTSAMFGLATLLLAVSHVRAAG